MLLWLSSIIIIYQVTFSQVTSQVPSVVFLQCVQYMTIVIKPDFGWLENKMWKCCMSKWHTCSFFTINSEFVGLGLLWACSRNSSHIQNENWGVLHSTLRPFFQTLKFLILWLEKHVHSDIIRKWDINDISMHFLWPLVTFEMLFETLTQYL